MLLVKCCATNSSFIKKNKITTAQTFCSFIYYPKIPTILKMLHGQLILSFTAVIFIADSLHGLCYALQCFCYFSQLKLISVTSCTATVCVRCVTCCLLFKFCMASPGLPCPRPCPGRLLLARGSFRLGEGRNGDGEVSSDRTPSWSEAK